MGRTSTTIQCGGRGMKMTRSQFYVWANKQTQSTENEMLWPHNRDVADSEIVEVLPWDRFVFITSRLIDGKIEIIEEEEEETKMKTVRDIFVTLDEEHGIQSNSMFHADLDQKITDEEYQRQIDFMVKIMNIDNWGDDEEEEE